MDLLSYLQDVRVRCLHMADSCDGRHENVFIHRAPDKQTHRQIETHQTASFKQKLIDLHIVQTVYHPNLLLLKKYLHADFVSSNNKGDLSAPGVDKTGPARVQDDVFSISCTDADGRVVKRLPCTLNNCRERWNKKEKNQTMADMKHWSFICFIWLDSLFLWMASMTCRSLGCRWRRTGVPIRSWGRYPRRGTALIQTKHIISVYITRFVFRDVSADIFSIHASPIIHILEHTTWSVCGGENALIRRNSGRCEEFNLRVKLLSCMNSNINQCFLRVNF